MSHWMPQSESGRLAGAGGLQYFNRAMDDNATQPPPPPTSPPPYAAPPPPPPPPLRPPPPFAAAAPARRGGRGWMIVSILLIVLLAFSMLLNVGLFSGASHGRRITRTVGPRPEEVLTEDNDALAKIAVIEIRGIITSRQADGGFNMVDLVKAQFKRAEEDERIKAVILKVDSPGGDVLASDEIYHIIADFQSRPNAKPVI